RLPLTLITSVAELFNKAPLLELLEDKIDLFYQRLLFNPQPFAQRVRSVGPAGRLFQEKKNGRPHSTLFLLLFFLFFFFEFLFTHNYFCRLCTMGYGVEASFSNPLPSVRLRTRQPVEHVRWRQASLSLLNTVGWDNCHSFHS